jgi:hypothetical protein
MFELRQETPVVHGWAVFNPSGVPIFSSAGRTKTEAIDRFVGIELLKHALANEDRAAVRRRNTWRCWRDDAHFTLRRVSLRERAC